ncbi:MAG TPA: phosphoglucosamine mutase [Epulopiscium sp.]|nr:phosphoglucosamine mutase [Candidatus Epulonipiscium sp.]
MGKLFGTDGIRGVANTELTGTLAYDVGRAGAYVLTKKKQRQPKILVARDTRISGSMLEAALVGGICSVGANVISIGVVPTPAISFLTKALGADAGVMISASHNPLEYNGIKFFNREGYKLSDELEQEIEQIILSQSGAGPLPTGEDVGIWEMDHSVIDLYIDHVCSTIPGDLKGIKVLIDCANGAAYEVAPQALERLGAEVEVIHHKPNGININKLCGSTHMNDLMCQVVGRGMAVGIAFDGDADRCLAVDENGKLVDGDQILAICGLDMKQGGRLNKDTIVTTVMSNLGLNLMAAKNDIQLKQTRVGDRYVLEKMIKDGYNIGGEQSGHVIFLDHNTTGDGLITAIQLLYIMKKTGKSLSELSTVMEVMPQVLVNAIVKNEHKHDYIEDLEIREEIKKLEARFGAEGRVLIRASGTEPLVRVMIEGKNEEEMKEQALNLARFIEEKLG